MRVAVVSASVLAVAPLTWWLAHVIPDDIPPDRLYYADYAIKPLGLSSGERLGIGLMALAAVGAGLIVLVDGINSGAIRRDWLGVVLPTAALTSYLGFGYRIGTVASSGANIGFGLLVFGALVAVPVLGVIAVIYLLRLFARSA